MRSQAFTKHNVKNTYSETIIKLNKMEHQLTLNFMNDKEGLFVSHCRTFLTRYTRNSQREFAAGGKATLKNIRTVSYSLKVKFTTCCSLEADLVLSN
jgi:hypothetical protein